MGKTLIHNCRALLMDETGTLQPDAFVVVEGDRIASVTETRPEGTFDSEIDGKGNVLMPGLVNAHTHVPMTLLRGYGGGCDLQTWLQQWIFPAEARLDDRAVTAGTGLGRTSQLPLTDIILPHLRPVVKHFFQIFSTFFRGASPGLFSPGIAGGRVGLEGQPLGDLLHGVPHGLEIFHCIEVHLAPPPGRFGVSPSGQLYNTTLAPGCQAFFEKK